MYCAECKKNGAHRYFRVTYKGYGDFSKMPPQVVTAGSSILYCDLFIIFLFLCAHYYNNSVFAENTFLLDYLQSIYLIFKYVHIYCVIYHIITSRLFIDI